MLFAPIDMLIKVLQQVCPQLTLTVTTKQSEQDGVCDGVRMVFKGVTAVCALCCGLPRRLEFKIGQQPLNDFRMIELHYFKVCCIRNRNNDKSVFVLHER